MVLRRRSQVLICAILLICLAALVSASSERICYIGSQDALYNELSARGYELSAPDAACSILLINGEEPMGIEPDSFPQADKLIYVNAPPTVHCTERARYNITTYPQGELDIEAYGVHEHIHDLDIWVFGRRIMQEMGTFAGVAAAYKRSESPHTEYFAFDIMKSAKLMEALFPVVSQTDSLHGSDALGSPSAEAASLQEDIEERPPVHEGLDATDVSEIRTGPEGAIGPNSLGQTDEDREDGTEYGTAYDSSDHIGIDAVQGAQDSTLARKVSFAFALGLLLNFPLCMVLFVGTSLDLENRRLVRNFLFGRALGLLALGFGFIYLSASLTGYRDVIHLLFGVICILIGIVTYARRHFCKSALGYAGGFAKGITPCMKFTPVLPLLLGVSVIEGFGIMISFIAASTLYFLLIYLAVIRFGPKAFGKVKPLIIRRIASAVFMLLGLYYIWRGVSL